MERGYFPRKGIWGTGKMKRPQRRIEGCVADLRLVLPPYPSKFGFQGITFGQNLESDVQADLPSIFNSAIGVTRGQKFPGLTKQIVRS